MRIGRLSICHSGLPPFLPNWSISKRSIAIAGWWIVILDKEFLKEIKTVEKFWS